MYFIFLVLFDEKEIKSNKPAKVDNIKHMYLIKNYKYNNYIITVIKKSNRALRHDYIKINMQKLCNSNANTDNDIENSNIHILIEGVAIKTRNTC